MLLATSLHYQDKPGISIMADRGVELNLAPSMEGRNQFPAEEVQEGRKIMSLCICVERAIGRIKTFSTLRLRDPCTRIRAPYT